VCDVLFWVISVFNFVGCRHLDGSVWVLNLVCDLREEHRLRMFESRALRRIFGPKRSEVTGGCRKVHNEELCNVYSLPGIIRMIN
jgi:hypothetical protein